jgi:protein SDA1
MAAVSSSSYKGEESDKVAALLMDLLVGSSNGASSITQQPKAGVPLLQTTLPLAALQLHRDIRKACVSALILMRNKGAVPPLRLLQLFFQLMAVVPDKNLRESLYHHIVNDIRNINKNGKKDEKLNRTIQSFFHRIVTASANESTPGGEDSPTDYAAKRAVQATCDLYRRNVWNDERSVHILASAASSPNASVCSRALRFFLNIEEAMALDQKSAEDSEWAGVNQRIDLHLHSKKTKHKARVISKQVKNRQKAQHEREGILEAQRVDKGVEASRKLFPAIELLNDPQGLCETILKRVKSSGSNTYKFEVKMLMLNFVTRVVGNHELTLLSLYTLLQRYMGGHQRDVTAILAYSVQSCHEYVPPEEIYGILKTIAHNFITERCSGEQMAVGINAVRAICARVPSVLSGEDDIGGDDDNVREKSTAWDVEAFTRDLAGYAKHKDRSVSIAGRGWVNFIREVYPSLLQGKDRGLVGAGLHRAGEKPLRYGEVRAASGVAGADLLAAYEAAKKNKKGGDSDNDDGWEEVDSDEEEEIPMNDEEEDSDEEAPDLLLLDEDDGEEEDGKPKADDVEGQDKALDLSKMSAEDRAKLQQQVSSTRIFTTAEFAKMNKLVERQQRAKRDPRLAAKLRRAKERGEEYEDLSDSDMDSDDEDIHIKGAVNAVDIMAEAKRKRMSKAEKLEKIIEGRQKWESRERAGGSTNTEKKRKKNFAMSKFAYSTRQKISEKETTKQGRKQKGRINDGRAAKKRRRKF